jgi:hypothetical protein
VREREGEREGGRMCVCVRVCVRERRRHLDGARVGLESNDGAILIRQELLDLVPRTLSMEKVTQ